MTPNLLKMEKLVLLKSNELIRVQNEPVLILKIDLEYMYGNSKLTEETSRHCNFAIIGGNNNGYYRFKKVFYGLCDIHAKF